MREQIQARSWMLLLADKESSVTTDNTTVNSCGGFDWWIPATTRWTEASKGSTSTACCQPSRLALGNSRPYECYCLICVGGLPRMQVYGLALWKNIMRHIPVRKSLGLIKWFSQAHYFKPCGWPRFAILKSFLLDRDMKDLVIESHYREAATQKDKTTWAEVPLDELELEYATEERRKWLNDKVVQCWVLSFHVLIIYTVEHSLYDISWNM